MTLHEEIANELDDRYDGHLFEEHEAVAQWIIAKVREHDWDKTMEYVKANRADERVKTIERVLAAGDKLELPGEYTGIFRQGYAQAINDYQNAIRQEVGDELPLVNK